MQIKKTTQYITKTEYNGRTFIRVRWRGALVWLNFFNNTVQPITWKEEKELEIEYKKALKREAE